MHCFKIRGSLLLSLILFIHCAHVKTSNSFDAPPEKLICTKSTSSLPKDEPKPSSLRWGKLTLSYQDKRTSPKEQPISSFIDYHCSAYQPKPLPTWRKATGGAAIAAGSIAILLGLTNLFTPVFKTSGGCIAYGLEMPCIPDRRGVGSTLIVGGALVAGLGGGFLLGFRY